MLSDDDSCRSESTGMHHWSEGKHWSKSVKGETTEGSIASLMVNGGTKMITNVNIIFVDF